MSFTQREKYIGIGVGAAVALLALDQLVLTPYKTARDKADMEYSLLVTKQQTALKTLEDRSKLSKTWNTWKAGVKGDPSLAESQALNAILDWAQNARVTLAAVRPERVTAENGFQVSGFHLTGTGSMAQITRFLWAFESAKVPVRVSDIVITSAKEGTDDLSLQMNFSTISMSTEPEKSARVDAGSAGTGGAK